MKNYTNEDILNEIADIMNVEVDILTKRKLEDGYVKKVSPDNMNRRIIAVALLRYRQGLSHNELRVMFNAKTHCSIIHYLKKFDDYTSLYKHFRDKTEKISNQLEERIQKLEKTKHDEKTTCHTTNPVNTEKVLEDC